MNEYEYELCRISGERLSERVLVFLDDRFKMLHLLFKLRNK